MKDFSTQEKYIYCHKYSIGDVVLFDSFTTMHRAKTLIDYVNKEKSNARLLLRLSCNENSRFINLYLIKKKKFDK